MYFLPTVQSYKYRVVNLPGAWDVAYALSFRGNVHKRIQIGGRYGIKYIEGK